jgi:hypothetical protein
MMMVMVIMVVMMVVMMAMMVMMMGVRMMRGMMMVGVMVMMMDAVAGVGPRLFGAAPESAAPRFPCRLCGLSFASRSGLRGHEFDADVICLSKETDFPRLCFDFFVYSTLAHMDRHTQAHHVFQLKQQNNKQLDDSTREMLFGCLEKGNMFVQRQQQHSSGFIDTHDNIERHRQAQHVVLCLQRSQYACCFVRVVVISVVLIELLDMLLID